ncbi:dienelactone hydrolase family protein [Desulfonatronum sp. SC1]|uniref:dienelactone hydrolase family protein n=1 Tax=Desulfonatronum sp. SC1 TaxID=2109626 RepID=UPI000D31F701|nr:dienelactone hydrolase family protein [Desulfonatronum sp. SC1]PTN35635.1 hypothetical protein C6366_11110 [Desulfonatronum sp. SC1]
MTHMQRFIVSDIFGRTKALEQLASELSGNIEIIDPYNSEIMEFENEDAAYSYFTKRVGLHEYTDKISDAVKASNCHVSLLGFSVGASAIWKLSGNPDMNNIIGAVLFYGSQIRHYTEKDPLFPINLVFPKTEKHFSVAALISKLIQKDNVQIHRSNYHHGFMNYHSRNYSESAYKKYMQTLCNVPFNKSIHMVAFDGACRAVSGEDALRSGQANAPAPIPPKIPA